MPSTFQQLKKLQKKDCSDLPVIKVSLLGDSATQFLATALKGEAVSRGYRLDLFEAEYNQIERQVLDIGSDFHSFGADFTIVFHSSHKLLERHSLGDNSTRQSLAQDRLEFVRTLCETVKGKIIYYNYPEIGDTVFGSYQNKVDTSFIYQVRVDGSFQGIPESFHM